MKKFAKVAEHIKESEEYNIRNTRKESNKYEHITN